jgi:hypothetical protein
MAACEPYPNADRQRDHRNTTALMTPHANCLQVVVGMRIRMSLPTSISTVGPLASALSYVDGDTTTSPNPVAALPNHRLPVERKRIEIALANLFLQFMELISSSRSHVCFLRVTASRARTRNGLAAKCS